MARYLNFKAAAAAGYRFEHQAEQSRFVLLGPAPTEDAAKEGGTELVLGTCHYTAFGDIIDFDSTVVNPALRGTGLSALLAEFALKSEVTKGRTIHASCWFIERMIFKNPDWVGEAA